MNEMKYIRQIMYKTTICYIYDIYGVNKFMSWNIVKQYIYIYIYYHDTMQYNNNSEIAQTRTN